MHSEHENNLKNIALFFVLLLPFSLFIGSVFVEICICATGILFLACSFVEKDWHWLNVGWVKGMLLFWAYITTRSLLLENFHDSFVTSLVFFRLFIFAIAVGYWVFRVAGNLRKMMQIIIALSFFICLNTVAQFIFGIDFFGNTVDYQAYPRLTTPHNKLIVGMMLTMLGLPSISYLLAKLTYQISLSKKIAILGYIFLLVAVVFISGERTPFLILITGIVCMLINNAVYRKYAAPALLSLVLMTASIFAINPKTIDRQLGETSHAIVNFYESSYGASYKMGWEIFKNHPLLGVGTKKSRDECKNTELYPSHGCYLHVHNIYLEALAENGIVGFMILVFVMFLCMKDIFSHRASLRDDAIAFGALLIVFLRLIPIISGPSFHTAWAFAPFWLMLGIGYSIIWRHKHFEIVAVAEKHHDGKH